MDKENRATPLWRPFGLVAHDKFLMVITGHEEDEGKRGEDNIENRCDKCAARRE